MPTPTRSPLALASLCTLLLACGGASRVDTATPAVTTDPQRAADELLAADRAFAAASAQTDIVMALGQMFDSTVIMSSPGGHLRGRVTALAVLRKNPSNTTSHLEWTPIRVGVSSDGQHGFTQGYTTIRRENGSTVPGKYLAYWIRHPEGWRVAVYKRSDRPAGDVPLEMLAPSLPVPGLPPGDEKKLRRFAEELRAAEVAFSDEAGRIGVPSAFRKWGAPDATNMGGGAPWTRGPDAIAKELEAGGSGPPGTTLAWAPSDLLVAATGDLGASIGIIKVTTPLTSTRPSRSAEVPFITIWRRATPRDPWRYVAE